MGWLKQLFKPKTKRTIEIHRIRSKPKPKRVVDKVILKVGKPEKNIHKIGMYRIKANSYQEAMKKMQKFYEKNYSNRK